MSMFNNDAFRNAARTALKSMTSSTGGGRPLGSIGSLGGGIMPKQRGNYMLSGVSRAAQQLADVTGADSLANWTRSNILGGGGRPISGLGGTRAGGLAGRIIGGGIVPRVTGRSGSPLGEFANDFFERLPFNRPSTPMVRDSLYGMNNRPTGQLFDISPEIMGKLAGFLRRGSSGSVNSYGRM